MGASEVTAVVINLNGAERVVNCLKAIYSQDRPPADVVLVDNGSTDGSQDRVRSEFPEVRLHELSENLGPATARNVGLRLAATELVLLLDNDIYIEGNCLSRLLARYRAGVPALVCPRIIYFPERDRIQCDGVAPHFVGTLLLLHGEQPLANVPSDPVSVGGCPSACLLAQRSAVLAAGGFDEDYFFYFEDLEFNLRLAGLGYRFFCEPTAVALHDRGPGIPGLSYRGRGAYPARRFYLSVRNRVMTMLVHYRVRTLGVLLPVLAAYELAVLVLALRHGWCVDWLRAWLWQPKHFRSLSVKRRRTQSRRTRRDRDLLWGGPLPLAPGFVKSRVAGALVSALSAVLNGYWRLARHWVG